MGRAWKCWHLGGRKDGLSDSSPNIPTKRDLRFGWKWAISGLRQGSTSERQKTSCHIWKQEVFNGNMVKGHRNWPQEGSFGHIWVNSSSERIMTGMSHREPFFWRGPEWVSCDSKETMEPPLPSSYGLDPKFPTRCTFARLEGFSGEVIESKTYCQAGRHRSQRVCWEGSKLWTERVSCSGDSTRNRALLHICPTCSTIMRVLGNCDLKQVLPLWHLRSIKCLVTVKHQMITTQGLRT